MNVAATYINVVSVGKRKVTQSLYRPGWALGFEEVEAPTFHDSRHMKVVRSALHTGHLYPPGNTGSSKKMDVI
jgi:hypothetical protein